MAVASPIFFRSGFTKIINGDVDLDGDSWRAVLVTSSYTPDVTDTAWSDISTNEVAAGGNYSTHGASITLSVSESTGTITVDATDVSWSTATITAKYLVIVRDADANGAIASTDVPLCYVDLDDTGGSVSSVSANFDVTINAAGILTINIPDS